MARTDFTNTLVFNSPSTANIANNLPDDIYAEPPDTAVSSSGIGTWPPGPSYTINGPVSSARLGNNGDSISFAGCGSKAAWNAESCMCKVGGMQGCSLRASEVLKRLACVTKGVL